jgi:hypothetical protein
MKQPPVPETASQSPRLARYPSQRVIPGQEPSPRVAPRINPVGVSVDIPPSSQPNQALSSLRYGLQPIAIYPSSVTNAHPSHAPTPLVTVILI